MLTVDFDLRTGKAWIPVVRFTGAAVGRLDLGGPIVPKQDKKAKSKPMPSAAKPGVPKEAAEAFAKVEKEIEALEVDDLEPINVDIPRAVAVAVGAVPHVLALRGQVVEELPRFPIKKLEGLGNYALAAWYAHLLALPETLEKELGALLEEAAPLREDMLVAAEALAHKGYLDPTSVKSIREGQGNIDKANDLVALAALFSREWGKVKNKTTVEWREVEQAAALGPKILVALGARDQPGVKAPNAGDPAQRRARAFTLFVRAYDECRRAVHYLRWHEDDADEIVPSLFATRGRGKAGRSEESAAPEEDAPEGAAPEAPPIK
jgi:hypothetical protein